MLALKIALLALTPAFSHGNANEIFAELLGRPDRGGLKSSYEFRQYETKEMNSGKLGLRQHKFQMNAPLNSLSDRKWKLLVNGGLEEIESAAVFPNRRRLPGKIWDLEAGVSHMRDLEGDRKVAASFMVGSRSDRPFGALRDTLFEGNFVYKKPAGADASWLFFLNFANDRGFLNYVPLPGAAYFFRAAESLRVAVGVPFVFVFWSPVEKSVLNVSYFPLKNAQAKFSYFFFGPAHAYVQAKYHSQNSFPSTRSARKERLFYEEGRFDAGISMPLERHLLLDISGGYAIDRKYFLGEDQSDVKNGQVLRPGNSPFGAVRLMTVF